MSDPSAPTPSPVDDPVRARRRQVARWNGLAKRVGYLLYLAAIVAFALSFAVGFTSTMSTIIIGTLVAGSVVLAPAIIIGYAVNAAERDDRERGL